MSDKPHQNDWRAKKNLDGYTHSFVKSFYISAQQFLLVAGGVDTGSTIQSTVHVVSLSGSAATCNATADLTAPSMLATLIVSGQERLPTLCGGQATYTPPTFDTCWAYIKATNSWNQLTSSMSAPRVYHAVAPLSEEKFMLTGGGGGFMSKQDTSEYFDGSGFDATVSISPLPVGLDSQCMARIEALDQVALVGGTDGTANLRSFYVYDILYNDWSARPDLSLIHI